MEFLMQRLKVYKEKNPNELTEEQFTKIAKEIKAPKKGKTISDEYFDFLLWMHGLESRQESFAKYVYKRLTRKNAKKILEVGCGRTYRLSRMLQKKGFEMTCIDPKVELPTEESEIIVKKEMFDYNYDLSEYDFIIAQEPCDATEHIVRACIEQKKPFIITLCGVPHKLISGEEMENVEDWYEYLINISKDEEIKLRYISIDPLLRIHILLKN